MTDIDTSALEDLVTGNPTSRSKKAPWQPLDLDSLQEGMYLACDQSFTAAGLVALYVWPDRIQVMNAITIGSQPGEVGGWESDYERADYLREQVIRWMQDHRLMLPFWSAGTRRDGTKTEYSTPGGLCGYVHEAPPIGGGKFVHPEVSLLSGYAFRQAVRELTHHNAWRLEKLPMVRRQDHARLICGNANAKKPAHHHALKQLFPQIEGSELITNEATRDALSCGIFAAWREAQRVTKNGVQ